MDRHRHIATAGWDAIYGEISSAPTDAHLVVTTRGERAPVSTGTPAKPSDLAFNAGVLGWPARTRIPWSEALDDAEVVDTQEQYLFNTLYGEHLSTISERFNTLTYRYDQLDSGELPFITHYAGAHKPWHVPRRFSQGLPHASMPLVALVPGREELLAKLSDYESFDQIARLQSAGASVRRGKSFRRSARAGSSASSASFRPLGWLLVAVAKPFRRFIPRGTHPLH